MGGLTAEYQKLLANIASERDKRSAVELLLRLGRFFAAELKGYAVTEVTSKGVEIVVRHKAPSLFASLKSANEIEAFTDIVFRLMRLKQEIANVLELHAQLKPLETIFDVMTTELYPVMAELKCESTSAGQRAEEMERLQTELASSLSLLRNAMAAISREAGNIERDVGRLATIPKP